MQAYQEILQRLIIRNNLNLGVRSVHIQCDVSHQFVHLFLLKGFLANLIRLRKTIGPHMIDGLPAYFIVCIEVYQKRTFYHISYLYFS